MNYNEYNKKLPSAEELAKNASVIRSRQRVWSYNEKKRKITKELTDDPLTNPYHVSIKNRDHILMYIPALLLKTMESILY